MINYLEDQTVRYATYHQPLEVKEKVNGVEYQLDYRYGPDHQRCKSQLLANGLLQTTRIYVGAYEKQISTSGTQEIHYVNAGNGLCAMLVTVNGVTSRYHVFKDHLGNILSLVNAQGMLWGYVAKQDFDAWGRMRNPEDWTYDNIPQAPAWLYRGYTGHEHAEPFALINMNGRLYDPVNGRMLSADNYVAGTLASQGFNRYSYANNNPLSYTDPTGELAWFVPVIIGAIMGFEAGGIMGDAEGDWWPGDWDSHAWESAGIGAIVGATAGATFSAAYSSLFGGVDFYGFGAGAGGSFTGVTGTGWNITSNALLSASTNMASSSLQGGGREDILASGLIGLAAGGLGAMIGGGIGRTPSGGMPRVDFNYINKWTSVLNGAGSRAYLSAKKGGITAAGIGWNSAIGAGEGWLSATWTNWGVPSKGFGIWQGKRWKTSPLVSGRYITAFMSDALTSVPGGGIATTTLVGPPLAFTLNPWAGLGALGIQALLTGIGEGAPLHVVTPNYPYAPGLNGFPSYLSMLFNLWK